MSEEMNGDLERHQQYGNVGFKVVGLQITQLKSVLLTLLGPVIVFVGTTGLQYKSSDRVMYQ